jgi:hypothetical protein
VTEVSRRGGVLRNVGTEFKPMQELLRHSSLRSPLDIYTQAITPAKPSARLKGLCCRWYFRPRKICPRRSRHPRRPNREERQRREGNSTKSRQADAIRARKRVLITPRRGFVEIVASSLERMAGTTKLELATSDLTVQRFEVLQQVIRTRGLPKYAEAV